VNLAFFPFDLIASGIIAARIETKLAGFGTLQQDGRGIHAF